MILRRLAVRDFRRFDRFEASFAPGLNVILGNNEEGKSTLREAITLGLFEDPKTSRQKTLGLKRWGASQQFAIELDFEDDGRSFRLAKDFQAKTARLVELGSGETIQDVRSIQRQIAGLLGLDSRARFESTVQVSQRDITRIQDGEQIADSLAKLMTGGDQDVQAWKVLEDLDGAIRALKSASQNSPGPLVALPKQLESKGRLLDEKRRSLGEAEEAKAQLVSAEQRLVAARREIEGKETLERDVAEQLRLEVALASARQEEERLEGQVKRARDLDGTVARDETALVQYEAALAAPPEEVAELPELEARVAAVESAGVGEPAAARSSPAARAGLAVAGVVLAAIGLVGGLAAALPALFVLILVGAGLVAWALLDARLGATDAAELAAQIVARDRKADAEKAASRLRELLLATGCVSSVELREKRREGERLRRSCGEARAELKGLLAGRTLAGIEDERRVVSRETRDVAERLSEPAMILAKMDLASYRRLQEDIRSLGQDTIGSLESKIDDLRVAVRASQSSVDEVNALEEETQELSERLAAAQERQKVLALASHVLGEARAATMMSAQDVLVRDLGILVGEITGGRYTQVKVDPNGLGIQLLTPERGEPVDAVLDGDLSTGTVEQVYLAARLAIARLLARDRRPPFILDDPFVTFDAARTSAVMALCRRLSSENQVLLFTCHEAYREMADRVIELPALAEPRGRPQAGSV